MIKMICDKCKKEVQTVTRLDHTEDVYGHGVKIMEIPIAAYDLCDECLEKMKKLEIEVQDFMNMSDEEIELELYRFKVGDKVITDNGRVGTITDICTCESCKKRGFYEPRVELEIGLWDIYITDTDKNNGFKSFYKIGDKIFGNIDEECVERIKQSIKDRKLEIIGLERQLNVMQKLIEKKNNLSDLNN